MKEKTQTITFYGVCTFLFCYFLRIFNMPNELTVILGMLLCLVMVVQQKKIRIDAGICLLLITLGSYYVITNGTEGLFYSILYIPLVIYELGNYTVCGINNSKEREKQLMLLIFLLVAGFTIHGLLNSYMWFAGYAVPGTRRWPDFWSGEIVPGTQHAAYFIPTMALFVPAVFYFKQNIVRNSLLIILTAYFGYTAISTKSRMTVLIFAIVVAVQILLYIALEWGKAKEQLKSKKIWCCFGIFVVFAIIGAVTIKDSPIVVAFIDNLSKDGGILNNARFTAQKYAIQQIFDYPMGGRQMYLGDMHMAHNAWLDMLNVAGLIPFFAFTAYTIYIFYELICFLMTEDVSAKTKIMMTGFYGSFFLYFMVEPALEASIHWVTPWIMLNGIVHGWISSKRIRIFYIRESV